MRARQSPTRRRHSPGRPLRLRTSPAGSRSIAARMRSRSLRGSLRRDFVAAGATTASHDGSSGVSVRLRAQLGYVDCLASLVCRPALLGSCSIIPGVGLVIKRRMVEHPGNRVARRVGQRAKRRSGFIVAHRLNGVVQTLLHGHGLKVASSPQDNEPIPHSQIGPAGRRLEGAGSKLVARRHLIRAQHRISKPNRAPRARSLGNEGVGSSRLPVGFRGNVSRIGNESSMAVPCSSNARQEAFTLSSRRLPNPEGTNGRRPRALAPRCW